PVARGGELRERPLAGRAERLEEPRPREAPREPARRDRSGSRRAPLAQRAVEPPTKDRVPHRLLRTELTAPQQRPRRVLRRRRPPPPRRAHGVECGLEVRGERGGSSPTRAHIP